MRQVGESGLHGDKQRRWSTWDDSMREWCAREDFRDLLYTADQDLGDAPLVVDSFGEPGAPARCLGDVVAVAGEVGLDTLRALHATATG